jgi:hypothetical protein
MIEAPFYHERVETGLPALPVSSYQSRAVFTMEYRPAHSLSPWKPCSVEFASLYLVPPAVPPENYTCAFEFCCLPQMRRGAVMTGPSPFNRYEFRAIIGEEQQP